jgi:hypothetical protein
MLTVKDTFHDWWVGSGLGAHIAGAWLAPFVRSTEVALLRTGTAWLSTRVATAQPLRSLLVASQLQAAADGPPGQGGPQHQGMAPTAAAAQVDVLRIDPRPHQDRFTRAGQIGRPLNRAQGITARLAQPAIEAVRGHMHHPLAQAIGGWTPVKKAHDQRHGQGDAP